MDHIRSRLSIEGCLLLENHYFHKWYPELVAKQVSSEASEASNSHEPTERAPKNLSGSAEMKRILLIILSNFQSFLSNGL